MNPQQMPTVNGVSRIYCDNAPTLDVLRGEATDALVKLRSQIAEIEDALAEARDKPPTDSRSKKYLRLWKSVYVTKLHWLS